MASLRKVFKILPDAEVSIEVDPRTATSKRLAHLCQFGFNRLSFGVQDFDEAVQVAVHRVQPYEDVRDLMVSGRELGYKSINVDLIYGLPKQTQESFSRTIEQVLQLRPDRIALYVYAHLPERFKPQLRILAQDLPDAATRIGLLNSAISGFIEGDYIYIGMDHFALPQDPLAQAKQQGKLHRNFQGYSTQPDCDLIALGVSSIGRCSGVYSQNVKTLDAYYERLDARQFHVERRLALSTDDLIRQEIIMEIMCQGCLNFAAIEQKHKLSMSDYFAQELECLPPLVDLGLIVQESGVMQLTDFGWYFVRAVALVFDRYLHNAPTKAQYSRIV